MFVRILAFHRAVSRLPIGAISIGSFIHTDLVRNPRMPFMGPLRRGFLQSEQQTDAILRGCAERNPLFKDTLEQKARAHASIRATVEDRDVFLTLLSTIDSVFDDIESELVNRAGENRK